MRRILVLAGCVFTMAACHSFEDTRPRIPDGAIVFQLDPAKIQYHFVDSSGGRNLRLDWIWSPDTFQYNGWNCVGLVPSAASDTIGEFVFEVVGTNSGWVLLNDLRNSTLDTGQAYFLPPNDQYGTHGSYVLRSNGTLNLTWADGTQSRYFDPGSSQLVILGDSLQAIADIRERGDSIRTIWNVIWTRSPFC